MPFGNRCFLNEHKALIEYCCYKMKKINIKLQNMEALSYIEKNINEFSQNDFIYLDPPYTNTLAIYNEKRAFGGWTIDSDYRLFAILEKLDKCGIKWGMSNVFKNKDSVNQHLIDWCSNNKWNVYHLNKTYSALGKGNANSDEVYICNYSQNKWDDLD